MTYSDIALYAVLFAVVTDLYFIRVQMITRGIFWLSYGLIFPFQLLTNRWLTSNQIVNYSPEQIIGVRFAGALSKQNNCTLQGSLIVLCGNYCRCIAAPADNRNERNEREYER